MRLQTICKKSRWLMMSLIFPPLRILLTPEENSSAATDPPPSEPNEPDVDSSSTTADPTPPHKPATGLSALQPFAPRSTITPKPQSKASAVSKVAKRQRELLIQTANPPSGDEAPTPPLQSFLCGAKSKSAAKRAPSVSASKNGVGEFPRERLLMRRSHPPKTAGFLLASVQQQRITSLFLLGMPIGTGNSTSCTAFPSKKVWRTDTEQRYYYAAGSRQAVSLGLGV